MVPDPDPTRGPDTRFNETFLLQELGLIRKPASFMTSICDERGSELLYAGVPITKILDDKMGIGGVLGLLWFQRRLPQYACKFIEMCLMITADHGPAVSGAHNTIVCARAGKDLVSSLASGLLTIVSGTSKADRTLGWVSGLLTIGRESLSGLWTFRSKPWLRGGGLGLMGPQVGPCRRIGVGTP